MYIKLLEMYSKIALPMEDRWQEYSYNLGNLSLKSVCFMALPQFSIICLITARLVVERMFSIASIFSEYRH